MRYTKNFEFTDGHLVHAIVTDHETPTAQFKVEFIGIVDNQLHTHVELLATDATQDCAELMIPLLFKPDLVGTFFFEIHEDTTNVSHTEH